MRRKEEDRYLSSYLLVFPFCPFISCVSVHSISPSSKICKDSFIALQDYRAQQRVISVNLSLNMNRNEQYIRETEDREEEGKKSRWSENVADEIEWLYLPRLKRFLLTYFSG